jgi:hypothetical protein
MNIFFAVLIVLGSTGTKDEKVVNEVSDIAKILFVNSDTVTMRDKPISKGKSIELLEYGEEVEFLKDTKAASSAYTFKCKKTKKPWFKVKRRKTGNIGWVVSAALQEEKLKPLPEKWKAVVSIDASPDELSESEDWSYFTLDIQKTCENNGHYFARTTIREPCAIIGNDKITLSTMDMAGMTKKHGRGWVLIEKTSTDKIVKFLDYDIETKTEAEKFCGG